MTKKNKKIALFHCGFIYSGGGERIILEEARHLKQRGWIVEVYAPTLSPKKCYPELLSELNVKTFLPSYIDSLPLRNAIRMLVTSLLAPFLAYKFRDVDVFVGANQPGAWIAFCIAKTLHKPYVVYLNQPNRLLYPRPIDKQFGWYHTERDYHYLNYLFKMVRPLFFWFDRLSITHGQALLANGHYIGDVIENIYGKKICDTAAGAYAQPHDSLSIHSDPYQVYQGNIIIGKKIIPKPYALITNRHDPQKRFDYVIQSMQQVIKKYPSAQLVIPGPFTDHTPELIVLSKKLKISDHVHFLGQISETELHSLYRDAAVYCYPAPEEDFGLGPLEAGGWGVPTVAWNHAGPTITIKHGVTGFLARTFDIQDYANHIMKLFEDKMLRSRMGKAAWERTKNIFSWEAHTDKLEAVLLPAVK